jgi:hypothetical protein
MPILFVARMLVIFLIWIRGMKHVLPPFLPFFEFMDGFRGFQGFFFVLDWIYWISLIFVFMGFRFQTFSMVLALLIFMSVLFSRLQYSNSFLYCGCSFFLIGIYRPGLEWIFRVQIALLYLGAGINKLLDPDWLSGQYFQFFFREVYPLPEIFLTSLTSKTASRFFSYSTIATEIGLGVWALLNRKNQLLVLGIHFFHLSMLVLTKGELSFIFFFLMAVTGYLILPWGGMQNLSAGSPPFSYPAIRKDILKKLKNAKSTKRNLRFGGNWNYRYFGSLITHPFFYGLWVIGVVGISKYKNYILALFQ